MRIVGFTVTLLVLLIALSWYGITYLQSSADEMVALLKTAENYILEENWAAAQTTLQAVNDRWNEIQTRWKILIDHRETDEIEAAITRLRSFSSTQDQGEALSELAVLSFRLKHIPAKERLLLRNIF